MARDKIAGERASWIEVFVNVMIGAAFTARLGDRLEGGCAASTFVDGSHQRERPGINRVVVVAGGCAPFVNADGEEVAHFVDEDRGVDDGRFAGDDADRVVDEQGFVASGVEKADAIGDPLLRVIAPTPLPDVRVVTTLQVGEERVAPAAGDVRDDLASVVTHADPIAHVEKVFAGRVPVAARFSNLFEGVTTNDFNDRPVCGFGAPFRDVDAGLIFFGLPGSALGLYLLWTGDFTPKVQWTLTLVVTLWWIAFAFAARERVVRPLQTLSNLVAALSEGDFSIRARGARPDEALGLALFEVNQLTETLRSERLGAVEALEGNAGALAGLAARLLGMAPGGDAARWMRAHQAFDRADGAAQEEILSALREAGDYQVVYTVMALGTWFGPREAALRLTGLLVEPVRSQAVRALGHALAATLHLSAGRWSAARALATLIAIRVATDRDVVELRVRARQRVVVELAVVGLDAVVRVVSTLVNGDELRPSGPAEGPIEAVVGGVRGHGVLDVGRPAEPLERIVAVHVDLQVFVAASAADALECNAVQLVVRAEFHPGELDPHVPQRAAVVVRLIAAVDPGIGLARAFAIVGAAAEVVLGGAVVLLGIPAQLTTLHFMAGIVVFLLAVGVVAIGGSLLVFLVKAGTVATLVRGERQAGPIEGEPLHLSTLRQAVAFSPDAYITQSRSLFPRYARLGLMLLAIYLASGGAYLIAVFAIGVTVISVSPTVRVNLETREVIAEIERDFTVGGAIAVSGGVTSAATSSS